MLLTRERVGRDMMETNENRMLWSVLLNTNGNQGGAEQASFPVHVYCGRDAVANRDVSNVY